MDAQQPQVDSGTAIPTSQPEVTRLRDLSPQQWKSGIAAWLGWLFDGLDMHLYVLVAAPFVAELLLVTDSKDPQVGYYSSWIQAAFLFGWALGGGFFGRIADRMGRSRALMLTPPGLAALRVITCLPDGTSSGFVRTSFSTL